MSIPIKTKNPIIFIIKIIGAILLLLFLLPRFFNNQSSSKLFKKTNNTLKYTSINLLSNECLLDLEPKPMAPTLLPAFMKYCSNPGLNISNNVPGMTVDLFPSGTSGVVSRDTISEMENHPQRALYSFHFYPASCNSDEEQCLRELKVLQDFEQNKLQQPDIPESEEFRSFMNNLLWKVNDPVFLDTIVNNLDLQKKLSLISQGADLLHYKEGACGSFAGLATIRLLAAFQSRSPVISYFYIRKYGGANSVHQYLVLNSKLPSITLRLGEARKQIKSMLEKMTGYICDPWNSHFKSVKDNQVRMYQQIPLDEMTIQTIRWNYDFSKYPASERRLLRAYNKELNNIIIKLGEHYNFTRLDRVKPKKF